jgi:5-(carboxyamino)imidazole ribonucleotide synthase
MSMSPTGLLRDLESDGVAVRPDPQRWCMLRTRRSCERLAALGAPCPVTRVVPDAAALAAFGDEQGWPIVAKTSAEDTTAKACGGSILPPRRASPSRS